MAKKDDTINATVTGNESPLWTALQTLAVTHQGQTVTFDNLTPDGLIYLIDYGLKQTLGDVVTVNRPAIMGKGSAPWKSDRLMKEAKRLGVLPFDESETMRTQLANAWCAEAVSDKVARIMSGELTVSESGVRGDSVMSRMKEIVADAINAQRKKDGLKAIAPGRDLTAMVMGKLAKPEVAAKVRAMAEADIERAKGLEV